MALLQEQGQPFEALYQAEDQVFDGVVYTLPTRPLPTDVTPPDIALVTATETICRQALETIQMLAKQPNSPRLYFVSTDVTPETQLVHAGLWGLLHTAQLEHPGLRCTYIQAETPEQIVAELLSDSVETQVIYRDRTRHVARIENYPEEDQNNPRKESFSTTETTQLVADSTGTLTGLRWQPTPRRQPNETEVEIRICATGLNFRDVLIAMGQYPDAAPLGCECVGEIVSVGSSVSAVSELSVGQRVWAIAGGSFAQYVTVPVELVAPVPESLTDSAAVTLPVAFSTAYYSLCQLAQLQRGERVLIHSAAGGVGQAAVQIAQQAGAEIFATASPRKWETLRALGITHIMNSRTLTFADEIMSLTNGEGVDVILNALPGEFRTKSLDSLGQKGRFVEIGKGEGLSCEEIVCMRPDIDYFTVDLAALCVEQPQQIQAMLRQLGAEVTAGHWRSLPVTPFTASDTISAFRTLQQGKHTGKIVLTHDATSDDSTRVSGSISGSTSGPTSGSTSGPTSSEAARSPSAVKFHTDASYLITGGLGGLGLVMAEWMAKTGGEARYFARSSGS